MEPIMTKRGPRFRSRRAEIIAPDKEDPQKIKYIFAQARKK